METFLLAQIHEVLLVLMFWKMFMSNSFVCIKVFFCLFMVFSITDLASDNSGSVDCSITSATISPLASPTNLLQQTEDQIPSNFEGPFVSLLPPLFHEDYLLGLGAEEGITDLFDACDLEKFPALVDEFLCS